MRKKFVYFVFVPFLVVAVVVYLFIDSWVEAGLEYAGDKAVGAKVEIDGLHLTLFPLGIRWTRLQVTDPNDGWKNVAETGTVRFAMDAGQLLRGKYIIETMEVNELILGTRRTTDGSIPKPPKKEPPPGAPAPFVTQAQAALDKTVEKTPMTNLNLFAAGINVDSLVKALDIRTLPLLDSVRAQAQSLSRQWDAAAADFETSKARLTDIEAGIKSINTSQLNTLPAITSAISTVDNAVKGVNEIRTTFDARRASLTSDVGALTASAGRIEQVLGDDFTRLKGMARIPNLNTAGIARLLVGDEMYQRALSYLHWVDLAREKIKTYHPKPEYESPPRMRGQDIQFPVERAYPKLWVKKILVSGGTDSAGTGESIHARGEIRNITNDQTITRVPISASLEGTEGGGRAFTLTAVVDRTKDVPFDEYAASLGGVPVKQFSLGKEDFLAAKITDARMTSKVKITVPGNAFDANTAMSLSRFTVNFAGPPKNTLGRIVRDVLSGINAFEVQLRLWTTPKGFDVALATDLDDAIAKRVQMVLGAELTKLQQSLKAKLDAVVSAKRAEVEKLVAEKRALIERQLSTYQGLLSDKLAMVESKKKELTDRLEKEKKGKVKDILKGVLKK
ncbi:MAG: TIGR03545 family protein [Bacteroidota bacterium]